MQDETRGKRLQQGWGGREQRKASLRGMVVRLVVGGDGGERSFVRRVTRLGCGRLGDAACWFVVWPEYNVMSLVDFPVFVDSRPGDTIDTPGSQYFAVTEPQTL